MRGNKLTLNILVMFFLLVLGIAFMSVVINNDENTAYAEAQVATIDQSSKFVDSLNITNENLYNVSKNNTIIDIALNSKAFIQEVIFQEESKDCNIAKVSETDFSIEVKRHYSYFKLLIPITVILTNKNKLEISIYIYENEDGVFFSGESIEKAEEAYIDYALDASLITKAEYEELYSQIYQSSTSSKYLKGTKGDKDTYVQGCFMWADDNNVQHPLREVIVEAYDANSVGGDKLLGSATTDLNGCYYITFQNNDSIFDNGGSDLYIKLYAGDDNVYVVDNNNNKYVWTSDKDEHQNVATGSTTDIGDIIYMFETIGPAMQISQALIVARDFAQSQMGRQPIDLKAKFPTTGDSCNYIWDDKIINVPNLSGNQMTTYASWDALMHEYGHHISHELEINQSPHMSHTSSENDAQRYNDKDIGIHLAWAESWPTVFGLIAQQEYAYSISNITTVCDSAYKSYRVDEYDIESEAERLGEACEQSIMAVLWDLYDTNSNNEPNDKIHLSASQWWNVTAVSGTYTFSDFIQQFYNQYPNDKEKIGLNLEYYHMCATDFEFQLADVPTEIPEIRWSSYSGWENHALTTTIKAISYNGQNEITILESSGEVVESYINLYNWNIILGWESTKFKIQLISRSADYPSTGPYYSHIYEKDKPLYEFALKSDNTYEIVRPLIPMTVSISLPSRFNNRDITSIGYGAFRNNTDITYVSASSPMKTIGAYAFDGCTALTQVYFENASIETIGDYAFNNCPINNWYWKEQEIHSIGSHAFYGSRMSRVFLPSNVTCVGDAAFGDSTNATIYTGSNNYSQWDTNWNPSNRPVIRDCVFASSYDYVVSFEKTTTNPGNSYNGTISNPGIRTGYNFACWIDSDGNTVDLTGSYVGTVYSKWNKESSSSCITTGSLITLADGNQVAVETLTGNEQLLVWDMYTGTFSSAPILFMDVDPTTTYEVIKLGFSDGTIVNVIDEHAFFDITLNKYVFLRNDASQYIGHFFSKHNLTLTGTENVQLMSVTIEQEVTTAYSPVTYGHLCYYVNGMLSMPGNTESFINIFEVDPETLAYDETLMMQDIATYGLYTYEEFNSIIPLPEIAFNAFNGQYLKVAIGKGITTLEEIEALLDRYSVFFE